MHVRCPRTPTPPPPRGGTTAMTSVPCAVHQLGDTRHQAWSVCTSLQGTVDRDCLQQKAINAAKRSTRPKSSKCSTSPIRTVVRGNMSLSIVFSLIADPAVSSGPGRKRSTPTITIGTTATLRSCPPRGSLPEQPSPPNTATIPQCLPGFLSLRRRCSAVGNAAAGPTPQRETTEQQACQGDAQLRATRRNRRHAWRQAPQTRPHRRVPHTLRPAAWERTQL